MLKGPARVAGLVALVAVASTAVAANDDAHEGHGLYLVRDLERVLPARLSFDGHAWQLPASNLVASGGFLWRVQEDGSVERFLEGWVVAQLSPGELAVLRPQPGGAWFDLVRTDGHTVFDLASSLRLISGSGEPPLAQIGAGVLFNGVVLTSEGSPELGRWYADGTEAPRRVANIGWLEPSPPFGPLLCAGTLPLGDDLVFCSSETASPGPGALWAMAAASPPRRLSPPGSHSWGMVRGGGGQMVLGLTSAGPFRTDGTAAGTEIFTLPGQAGAYALSEQTVALGEGLGWLNPTEAGTGFWWLPPAGVPKQLLAEGGSLYALGAAGDHAYLSTPAAGGWGDLFSVSTGGQRVELASGVSATFLDALGAGEEALLRVVDSTGAVHLAGTDGTNLVQLRRGRRDHEGTLGGPSRYASRLADGVLVGLGTLQGQTLPWLVRPGFALERWHDLRLGGTASSNPWPLRRAGERLVFYARTSRGGTRLWQSNGSAETTRALSHRAHSGCRTPAWRELEVVSDGIIVGCIGPDGAVPILELPPPGSDRMWARELGRVPVPVPRSVVDAQVEAVALGHRVLVARSALVAFDTTTSAAAVLVEQGVGRLVRLGDRVIFLRGYPAPEHGLWATDGSLDGATRIIQDGSGWPVESAVVAVGSSLLVSSRNALYVSDGTAEGSREIGAPMTLLPSPPAATRVCGLAPDPLWGHALWSVDPESGAREYLASTEGWQALAPGGVAVDDASVWFLSRRQSDGAVGLWRCDGTREGSVVVVDGLPEGIRWLAPTPGGVYLLGLDAEGTQLLVVARDGATVELVASMSPTINHGDTGFPDDPDEPRLVMAGSHVFVTMADDAHGRELWAVRWDKPTAASAQRVGSSHASAGSARAATRPSVSSASAAQRQRRPPDNRSVSAGASARVPTPAGTR